jgi:hypothetical protein
MQQNYGLYSYSPNVCPIILTFSIEADSADYQKERISAWLQTRELLPYRLKSTEDQGQN